jgi:hypothetical protein
MLTPAWSLRVIAALAVLLAVVALWRWWRERRGGFLIVLRWLVLAVLIGVMLNPQSLLPREQSGKPKLVVLLDTSSSMNTRDAGGDSRFAAAARLVTNNLARLNHDFVLEWAGSTREARPLDWSQLKDFGDASDIGAALMSSVSDLGEQKSQAGVLLLSDGRATAAGALDAAQLALARSVPLWTHCVGGAIPRHDLWIETASSEPWLSAARRSSSRPPCAPPAIRIAASKSTSSRMTK